MGNPRTAMIGTRPVRVVASERDRLQLHATDCVHQIFDVDSPFVYPDEATAIRAWNSSGVAQGRWKTPARLLSPMPGCGLPGARAAMPRSPPASLPFASDLRIATTIVPPHDRRSGA